MTRKSGNMSRPLGVTLLSILQFVSGLGNVLTGLGILGVSSTVVLPEAQKNLLTLVGLVMIVLGISGLWLSRGYFIGYEWARRKGRVVAMLSILFALFAIVLNLPEKLGPDSPGFSVLWNAIIYIYLGRPKVVAYFAGRWTGKPWSSKPRQSQK